MGESILRSACEMLKRSMTMPLRSADGVGVTDVADHPTRVSQMIVDVRVSSDEARR